MEVGIATSGLSADNPGAGVNKPYVEPALAGDNKAFDFSRELFTDCGTNVGILRNPRRTAENETC